MRSSIVEDGNVCSSFAPILYWAIEFVNMSIEILDKFELHMYDMVKGGVPIDIWSVYRDAP